MAKSTSRIISIENNDKNKITWGYESHGSQILKFCYLNYLTYLNRAGKLCFSKRLEKKLMNEMFFFSFPSEMNWIRETI